MEKGLLLPSFYLAPITYYSQILENGKENRFERFEHYPKQTYRNRATIHSPNGKLDLIVPVKKGVGGHTKMRDVRISYEFDWQRLHWMSLQTSYRSSAYFEFYEDDFARFYEKKTDFLIDYTFSIHEYIMKLLKIERQIKFTSEYEKDYPELIDLRNSIHPKKAHSPNKHYFQVFESNNGFIPNLSIVDLLFNKGPESKEYI